MALLEKDRNTIYTEFRKILGEEATQAMRSQFPARDVDEPVTKEHLDRRLAELQIELSERLTSRMLTIAGLEVAAVGVLMAVFR